MPKTTSTPALASCATTRSPPVTCSTIPLLSAPPELARSGRPSLGVSHPVSTIRVMVERDFCFVHAADLHLDTPFEGVRASAPDVADALADASLAAFDSIVALAISRRAAFLVVSGDVYDGPERGVRAQLRFHRG